MCFHPNVDQGGTFQYSSSIKLSKYTGFQLNHLLLTAGEQDWERKPLLVSVIFQCLNLLPRWLLEL
ncbi:hypothetical protein SLEP1_g50864 [Rubroshorea leprosula]|uniref:Uncharacterized protein n=1 Tax=Rubroshorea leprosula TaxID=152421 RepID=A0AAV5M1L6_9ROSI|nr:hypothetical protein SLEP1_g50864 [Rubroshorea leprosula]